MNSPPPVEPVASGVWRVTTPLPFRPREVHAYLIESGEAGWILVDGGINTDDAWTTLAAGVRQLAGGWEQVRTHVVTHMHIDHLGLARRVRDASGAMLVMGQLDAERAAHADASPGEEADYRSALLRSSGARDELWHTSAAGGQANPLLGFAAADELLVGETGSLPGAGGWSYVWTPGHTAGHVALFRSRDRVLIAGDAVLPRITPTIGVNRQRADPIGDYLGALQRLNRLAPALILPGHGEPIAEPATRLMELQEETQRESAKVASLLTDAAASAWEITRRRYAGRELPAHALVQALRETLAHLHHLVASGQAREETLAGEVAGYACR